MLQKYHSYAQIEVKLREFYQTQKVFDPYSSPYLRDILDNWRSEYQVFSDHYLREYRMQVDFLQREYRKFFLPDHKHFVNQKSIYSEQFS